MEYTLRLRPHHLFEIYHYMAFGSREEFSKARKSEREDYGNDFIENIIDLMEKFWRGHFTKLEVVLTEDDFCKSCIYTECMIRNFADKPNPNDRSKIFWIDPGLYESEEIKGIMREIYREKIGEYPPEMQ
jgi:hypothetical protein